MVQESIKSSFGRLRAWCEAEEFKGWDPYDGLNSRIFQALQLGRVRFFRLAWIQLFKRSPLNLRPLTGVPKAHNPKGLGLFLTAYCNLYATSGDVTLLPTIRMLADRLVTLQSPGYSGACWGYNFDWQSRAFFLPKYTPTVVVTSFVACALLDAHEATGEARYLETARNAAPFILKDLNRTPKANGFIFSYSPYDHTCVYNASLLGSRLLSRLYASTGDEMMRAAAQASVRACIDAQRDDGAWIYGELAIQGWVDSFHTGYNLEAIHDYLRYCGDTSVQPALDKGLAYYLEHFFLEDGTPRYYDDRTYPIDVHAPAQFVVTLYRLGLLETHADRVDRVLAWTLQHLQDPRGFFYYQLKPTGSSKIPYMRWAQAWMMYALSFYLRAHDGQEHLMSLRGNLPEKKDK